MNNDNSLMRKTDYHNIGIAAKADRKYHKDPGAFNITNRAKQIARRSVDRSGGVIRLFTYDRLWPLLYRVMREAYQAGLKGRNET